VLQILHRAGLRAGRAAVAALAATAVIGVAGAVAPESVAPTPGVAAAAPAPRAVGKTVGYNTGMPGQCTWGAMNQFRAYSGRYAALAGNAKDWYRNAKATGWSTSLSPQPNSMVVFQPGVQGASPYGHVGWVDRVVPTRSGVAVHIWDMNGPGGPFSTRWWWTTNSPGMTYILAPPRR
jgi:surface antigen